jgi:hypothetical protein
MFYIFPVEALRPVYGILKSVTGNCKVCFAAVSAVVFPSTNTNMT